jgi:hypothetical protein
MEADCAALRPPGSHPGAPGDAAGGSGPPPIRGAIRQALAEGASPAEVELAIEAASSAGLPHDAGQQFLATVRNSQDVQGRPRHGR